MSEQSGETQVGPGAGPLEAQYTAILPGIAHAVDVILNGEETVENKLPRQVGFALLVFNFDTPGAAPDQRCNVVTNGVKGEDLASLLREMAARLQGQPLHPEGRA